VQYSENTAKMFDRQEPALRSNVLNVFGIKERKFYTLKLQRATLRNFCAYERKYMALHLKGSTYSFETVKNLMEGT
jgi:hypothetical protein